MNVYCSYIVNICNSMQTLMLIFLIKIWWICVVQDVRAVCEHLLQPGYNALVFSKLLATTCQEVMTNKVTFVNNLYKPQKFKKNLFGTNKNWVRISYTLKNLKLSTVYNFFNLEKKMPIRFKKINYRTTYDLILALHKGCALICRKLLLAIWKNILVNMLNTKIVDCHYIKYVNKIKFTLNLKW